MSRLGGNMNFPGSQLGQQGVDGQRPNSPSSGDNAPSPKRPRVDGGFPAPPMGGNPAGPGQMPNGQGQNMAPNGMDPNNLALMNSMQGKYLLLSLEVVTMTESSPQGLSAQIVKPGSPTLKAGL